MTNGDYIRSMNNEMLARLIYKMSDITDEGLIEESKKFLDEEYDKELWEKDFFEKNEMTILFSD